MGVWLARKGREAENWANRAFERSADVARAEAVYRDAIAADLDSLAEYPALDGPWTASALAHIKACVVGIAAVHVGWYRPAEAAADAVAPQ